MPNGQAAYYSLTAQQCSNQLPVVMNVYRVLQMSYRNQVLCVIKLKPTWHLRKSRALAAASANA